METYRADKKQYDADQARWRNNPDEPMPVKPVAEHLYTTDATKEALVPMLQGGPGLTFGVMNSRRLFVPSTSTALAREAIAPIG